jgi:hypothetical protein
LSDDDRLNSWAIEDLFRAFYSLEKTNKMLDGNRAIAFSYGRCEVLYSDSNSLELSHWAPNLEAGLDLQIGVLQGKRICDPSATLMRVSDARSCGGYSMRFPASIDTGLIFKVASMGSFVAFVQRPTTFYTMHRENFTSAITAPLLAATVRELCEVVRSSNSGLGGKMSHRYSAFLESAAAKAVADLICHRQISMAWFL